MNEIYQNNVADIIKYLLNPVAVGLEPEYKKFVSLIQSWKKSSSELHVY